MALPNYQAFYAPFLKALKDGQFHVFKDLKKDVIHQMGLSDEDITEKLPSGKQSIFENRIGWARTYLKKAGLVESPERAKFILTDEGKKALTDADLIDDKYLLRYASFREFQNYNKNDAGVIENQEDLTRKKSPKEILEDAHAELNASLADDLMTEIMKLEPVGFEHLVVKLLLAMGYGSGIDNAGIVTQASNDGGIDGIIKEDQLGFSSIYIQAKRWNQNSSVPRPEIQKFVGALQEKKAQKGLFISTASFSEGAIKSAELAGVVLVDGKQLTKLMIKYNVGVSEEDAYIVKRLDTDFFLEEF